VLRIEHAPNSHTPWYKHGSSFCDLVDNDCRGTTRGENDFEFAGYPHPGLAAYAHLTRSLEGKPFVRKVALGENRFAYLFAGRGGSCAVLCCGRDAKLPFVRDPAIRWTDLFGNPLADSDTLPGTMRYAASALPPEALASRLARKYALKDMWQGIVMRPFLSEQMGHISSSYQADVAM